MLANYLAHAGAGRIRIRGCNLIERDNILLKVFLGERVTAASTKNCGRCGEPVEVVIEYNCRGNTWELKKLIERRILIEKGFKLTVQGLGIKDIDIGKIIQPRRKSISLLLPHQALAFLQCKDR